MGCFRKLLVALLFTWLGYGACGGREYTRIEAAELHKNYCNILPPFNHYQQPRAITVSIDRTFTRDEVVWVRKGLVLLDEFDFAYQEVPPQSDSDITIRRLNASSVNNLLGFYQPRSNILRIDPNRTPFEISGTVVHEFGHWLGMSHVCSVPNERDVYGVQIICSPVGIGVAAMNPMIRSAQQTSVTELDRLELRRTRRCQELLNRS